MEVKDRDLPFSSTMGEGGRRILLSWGLGRGEGERGNDDEKDVGGERVDIDTPLIGVLYPP